jgi:hypothetical protein
LWRDDYVWLLLADDLTDGTDQHERQAILDDAADHRRITDLKTYFVKFGRLSHHSVVIVRSIAQDRGRAWVIHGVDNVHLAVLPIQVLQRLGDGFRRATMSIALITG